MAASNPLPFDQTDQFESGDVRGILLNKAEIVNWQGEQPLDQYSLNNDASPQVISKKPTNKMHYKQQVAIRYLNPPTPPRHGDIIIRQEPDNQLPAAPPLVIRQVPAPAPTPAPIVIREAPPRPPTVLGTKIVTIAGRNLPPPARKIVLEKLPDQPEKPRSIFIEKWLPYKQQTRRVVFEKVNDCDSLLPNPKNLIIEWQKPDVEITHEVKNCGVAFADPEEYVRRYGPELSQPEDMPALVAAHNGPVHLVQPEQPKKQEPRLEGDVDALRLIDLELVGLGQYKNLLN